MKNQMIYSGIEDMDIKSGGSKESTLNFYKKNGFEIDKKHSCLKKF